tara:strand:+ start:37396 stop:38298 length:903 start_codon:yes stop_codon:yes gene_type:complete
MSGQRFICAVSQSPILEGQKIRVILGETLYHKSQSFMIGNPELKMQTNLAVAIPAISPSIESPIKLNKELISTPDFKTFLSIYLNEEYEVEELEPFLDIYINNFGSLATNSFTVILEEVYQLLIKDIKTRDCNNLKTKECLNVIDILFTTESHKDKCTEIKEKIKQEREAYYKDYSKEEMEYDKDYNEFEYILKNKKLCTPHVYLDSKIEETISKILHTEDIECFQSLLLLKQEGQPNLLKLAIETSAFGYGLSKMNLILTPAVTTRTIANQEQIDFKEKMLEINKAQLKASQKIHGKEN